MGWDNCSGPPPTPNSKDIPAPPVIPLLAELKFAEISEQQYAVYLKACREVPWRQLYTGILQGYQPIYVFMCYRMKESYYRTRLVRPFAGAYRDNTTVGESKYR